MIEKKIEKKDRKKGQKKRIEKRKEQGKNMKAQGGPTSRATLPIFQQVMHRV